MAFDVPAPPSRRRATRTGALLVVLALAVSLISLVTAATAAALVADQAAQAIELRMLVGRIEASEEQMRQVQSEEARVVTAFQAGDVSRTEMIDGLRAVAQSGSQVIAAAGGPIARMRILPWHESAAVARESYLAHNRAWVDYLDRAAADPAEFGRPQAAVNETFAAAQGPLLAAIPAIDPFGLRARIDAIFADGAIDAGPTQQA